MTIQSLLQSGLGNLASYLAAHVLLCLLPAFFIAGALTALVPNGVNFAYDIVAWKNWYARQQLLAPGTNLRRDL